MAKLITTMAGDVIFDESEVVEPEGDCPVCQLLQCGGIRTCASIDAEYVAWLKAINLDPNNAQWVAECQDIANILCMAYSARLDAGMLRAMAKIQKG